MGGTQAAGRRAEGTSGGGWDVRAGVSLLLPFGCGRRARPRGRGKSPNGEPTPSGRLPYILPQYRPYRLAASYIATTFSVGELSWS